MGAVRMRGFRRVAWTLAWLCAPLAAAQAACPAPEGLRAQVDHAVAAGASLDAAWGQARDAVRACAEPEAEAALMAEWTEAARRHGATSGQLQGLTEERLAFAVQHGLLRHEAEARLALAMFTIARGEVDAASLQLHTALDWVRRLDDIAGQARVLTELSRLERRRGDYLAALRFELTGVELRRRLNPPPELWRSLLNLGVLYEQIELLEESRRYYAEALAESERTGQPGQIADVLNGYAGFLNDFGPASASEALAMAERALHLQREQGDMARIGSCLLQVGRARLGLGQVEAAEAAFAESLQLAERGGYAGLRAHVEFRWGELELARGDTEKALARIERARAEYERQSNRHRLVKVHGLLERVHTARHDELAAARAGREHFRLRNELLGANASGKLGELLTNFALSEERHRSEALRQENAVATVRLESERRLRRAGYLFGLVVVFGLALLVWRHAAVRRLYRLLSDSTRETEAQRAALSEANARLTELNRSDALTGLASRSYGMEHLAELLGHARARGSTPALLLFDLDHFKDINDRHGHLVGDQVLAAVAATLRDFAPSDALVSRVGGEEFMLVLEQAQHDRAQVVADALRRRVRDLGIDIGSCSLQVTVSVGVAQVEARACTTVRELYSAADVALYEAKRAGRDCVRSAARVA